METGQIGKTIKEMKELRDNNTVDEEINTQLENLQMRLDSQCNVQIVKRLMTHDEKDAIMADVEW